MNKFIGKPPQTSTLFNPLVLCSKNSTGQFGDEEPDCHRGQNGEQLRPAEHRGAGDVETEPEKDLTEVVGVAGYAPQSTGNEFTLKYWNQF